MRHFLGHGKLGATAPQQVPLEESRKVLSDYFSEHVRYQPLDPVNLVFQGNDGSWQLLNEVLKLLDAAGWRQGFQDHQYLLEPDDHLRYETCWRTHGPLWNRYHVRLWQGDRELLGSAHRERIRMWPRHEVESFDDARRGIEDLFEKQGWRVHRNWRKMGSKIADPPADGCASLIAWP